MIYLDFEKPISDLLEQIEKAKQIAEKSKIDISATIRELEVKVETTRKEVYSKLTPWQRVQLSRHPDRPYSLSYIQAITEGNFLELFGDRTVKDDKAIVGGFGSVDGKTVMFVSQQKGNTTKQRQYRNFRHGKP
jgi:acetyl-CoA carboxylase carboxyl transferase subunit alpha